MGITTNIVINDGKATPQAHTFVGHSPQTGNTPAVWYNKVTGFTARAWEKLTTLVSLNLTGKGEHRMACQIHLPKVATVDGSEVLLGTLSGYISVVVPVNLSTTDNLKDLKALMYNALNNAELTEVFVNQKPST